MNDDASHETLTAFADYLRGQAQSITEEWVAEVTRDVRIRHARDLTPADMKEHMPEMLERLAELMRSPLDPANRRAAEHAAESYGRHRREKGYQSDELFGEMMRLREVIVGGAFTFEELNPQFTGSIRKLAFQRLHASIRVVFSAAAGRFVREEQDITRPDHEQLRTGNSIAPSGPDASSLKLLRTAAHEMRNLLNSAHLSVQELSLEDSFAGSQFLPTLTRNLHQMNDVLTDLLDFSVLAAGHRPLRISSLLTSQFAEELLVAFRGAAEAKGLRLEGECEASLGEVMTDRTKLKQIAVNLLSNAIKYTDVGSIHFWLRSRGDSKWTFGVKDTGPGFTPEVGAQLFHEFFRVQQTADREGTGLGLPIVKRLAEALGGTVDVQSEPGRGSCFQILVPRSYPNCGSAEL